MKWKKTEAALSMEPQDIAIMAQCNMKPREMFRRGIANKKIPPLWSVLSYVMLQYSCSSGGLWSHYRQLTELAKNAAENYFPVAIPKVNGGVRKIHVPNYALRHQQSFIYHTILSGLPIDAHAYAYRKGFRIKDCAKPHQDKDLVIHLDLENFFGSISENMVFAALLRETGYAQSLCRFLAKLCCFHGSLPQGTVTSPILSNIVFRCCDEELAALAAEHKMEYSRYSDDLYFSGADRDVSEFLQKASRILFLFGFKLNTEKTRVRRRQHKQTVLGLTVNERVQVTREYRRKLLQELYYLERFGKKCNGAIECGDYLRYMQQLQGKLAYVLHIDPDNATFLAEKEKLTKKIKQYAFLRERGFVD